jgi:TPR repeat protein
LPDNHIARAPEGSAPKTGDPGDEDLALAQRYLGSNSRPGDAAAATRFLWAAVQQGNVKAEIILAGLFARGDGVTKSCEQARVLLRAAAEKGSSEASTQLAQIIRSGCR